jgi:hypothetical protein
MSAGTDDRRHDPRGSAQNRNVELNLNGSFNLGLLKAFKAAMLGSKLPDSGECRLTRLRGPYGFADEVNR